MKKPDSILAEKTVSALFEDAKMGRLSKLVLGIDGRIGAAASKKMVGGFWVSGKAYLTEAAFEFHPGMINRPYYKEFDTLFVHLSWPDLTRITPRHGLVTKIIDLKTEARTLSIRCHGAEQFAKAIEATRAAQVKR